MGQNMSDTQSSKQCSYEQDIYEIRIQDHLPDRWSKRFAGLSITRESDGTTTLSGPLPDQTALHSILLRIRDMNLRLISVRQIETETHKESQVE
jgi:hypothetical protein